MPNVDSDRTGNEVSAGSGYVLRAAAAGDLPAVLALLEAEALPVQGVEEWLSHYVVAESAGRPVGASGLEVREGGALLRSVVVAADHKGRGLGSLLVADALARARAAGAPAVYLLTTTAERYFPRHGFELTDRSAVPADVRESVEFREACPASAAVMVKSLAGGARGPAGGGGTDCC